MTTMMIIRSDYCAVCEAARNARLKLFSFIVCQAYDTSVTVHWMQKIHLIKAA